MAFHEKTALLEHNLTLVLTLTLTYYFEIFYCWRLSCTLL